MNIQSKLEQFRSDNPYDFETQATRLLAFDDKELILHVLALGFATAKQRANHLERDHIKNTGEPPQERFRPGRTTGAAVKVTHSKKIRNAIQRLILDTWMVADKPLGDATGNDLQVAIASAKASANGQLKNAKFYGNLKTRTGAKDKVRSHWSETDIRNEIENVFGEFRKEAA